MNPFYFRLLLVIHVCYFSTAHCQNSIVSNSEGAEKVSFKSTEIITFLNKPLRDSLYLVSQNSKYGMIDSTGEIVVPLIYDQINVNFKMRETLLFGSKILPENELFYFFWENGNESEELFNTLLKQEMETPTSPYNLELAFRTEPFFAAKKEHLWGVINAKNEVLIPFEYDLIEEMGQNIFLAKKNNTFEILTPENKSIVASCDKIIFPPKSNLPLELGTELAAYALLIRDNKYGAINLFNLETILPKYDSLEFCAYAYEDECLCVFNPDGLRLYGKQIRRYHNVVKYQLDNKIGLLDMRCMQEITPASFDSIRIFNNYCIVSLNGKTGVYNDLGEIVLNLKWEDIQLVYNCYDYSSPYFIIKRNGKYGIVDARAKKVIAIRYDSITNKYENRGCFWELQRKGKLEKIEMKDL